MDFSLRNGLADSDEEDLDLGLGPAQDAREPGQAESLDAVEHVHLAPAAQLLLPLIFRPRVDGEFEDALLDVDEAGFLVPALQLVGDAQGPAERHGRVVEVPDPLEQFPVRRHRPVVAVEGAVELLRLHVSARLEVLEGAVDDLAEVFEAAEQDARVDVGEVRGRVEPVRFGGVVDQEVDVGGDHVRLGRGKVGADDGGGREEFGHVDGPYSRAGSYVQNPFGFM